MFRSSSRVKGSSRRLTGQSEQAQSPLPLDAVPQTRSAPDQELRLVVPKPPPDPRTVVTPEEVDMSRYEMAKIENSVGKVEFDQDQGPEAAPAPAPAPVASPETAAARASAARSLPKWVFVVGAVVLALVLLSLGIYAGYRISKRRVAST